MYRAKLENLLWRVEYKVFRQPPDFSISLPEKTIFTSAKSKKEVSISWKKWIALFLGSLTIFMLASWIIKRISAKPKRLTAPKPLPEENPLVWLRRELDRFASELNPEDRLPSAKSDELIALVRTYFQKVSKSPVRAWTLSEFQEKLAKDPAAQEVSELLRAWLPLHYVPDPKPEPLQAVTEEVEKVLLP